MKLILHIGSAKTGTSTLQKALREQEDALREQGVLYPRTGFAPTDNQSAIALEAITRGVPRIFEQNGRLTAHDVTQIYEASWRHISDQIAQTSPHTVILSSEFLFLTQSTAQLDPLLTRIDGLFEEVDVACYLRSPEAFFASKCLQVLRGATRLPRPGKFSYLGVLESYRAYFPTHARVFARNALKGGDIVQDFQACFLPDVPLQPVTDDANISISAEGMYIAAEVRKRFMDLPENKFSPEYTRLIRKIGRMEHALGIKCRPALQPWVLNELYGFFEPERKALADTYGIQFPTVEISGDVKRRTGIDLPIREVFKLDEDVIETLRWRLALGETL
ncbi:MAG: hypothetical protein AAFQ05_05960 [Pseudomonadota bacterium]